MCAGPVENKSISTAERLDLLRLALGRNDKTEIDRLIFDYVGDDHWAIEKGRDGPSEK
jgi:hypothetical protein